MKKIFILLVTLIGFICATKSQVVFTPSSDSSITIFSGKSGMGYQNIPIIFWSDSTITIEGDIIQAIRLLHKEYMKMTEKYWAAWSVLIKLNLPYLTTLLKNKSFTYAVRDWNKIKD
jgi:hypothetical protein